MPGIPRGAPVPDAQANEAYFQVAPPAEGKSTPGKARTADGRWIVFEVTKVGHADESEIKPEQRTQFLSVQAERLGDEDALATGRQERKRMRVDIAEDRL